ncbi:DUF1349 domain-containing protein [Rhizobium sp. YJ-22]|uniref:DUF1349 domain-containing protein n=1 Tax=Rhizobium sp. YJ-22 TaxID=3037556 RepID=UPI002412A33F|nr:DUF1349 domain-containing protein [Rhizobium sp. YJ-22]MDG3576084.1 DUF1349 domain-containing protein [Rhizobium sp. YJ-22]
MSSDFSAMSWLHEPPHSEMRDGTLTLRTALHTDFWQNTYYGFEHDNGHFLHETRRGDFMMEVRFSGQYEALYDQAGLMIRADARHWMKCGIELTDGHQHLSVVVTNRHSDWSAIRLPTPPQAMRLRVTRMFDALFIQYRGDDADNWTMARLAYFPPEFETLQAGIMACSPQREGFEARFSAFSIGEPKSRDIH